MSESDAIRKNAARFQREFGLHSITSDALTAALEKQGYTVIEYSQEVSDEDVEVLLDSLDLRKQAAICHGFSFANEKNRLVFVQEGLSESEKKIILAHEQGHIRLGHMTNRPFPMGADIRQEFDANEFAHYLLNGKDLSRKKKRTVTAAGLAVLAVIVCICIFVPTSRIKAQPVSYAETEFYVTKSGRKYHEADCICVRDREGVRPMTEAELQNGEYDPCSICNPDINRNDDTNTTSLK